MKTNEITIGQMYHIKGDMQNGTFITNGDIIRVITKVTDTHIYCECGRVFIINKNLKIEL